MNSRQVHFHFFSRQQIKPGLRGRLLYVLELPLVAGHPIVRQVYDPAGRGFPLPPDKGLLSLAPYGNDCVIFLGINKSAAYELLEFDPPILNNDSELRVYNRQLFWAVHKFFLTEECHDHCHQGPAADWWLQRCFSGDVQIKGVSA